VAVRHLDAADGPATGRHPSCHAGILRAARASPVPDDSQLVDLPARWAARASPVPDDSQLVDLPARWAAPC